MRCPAPIHHAVGVGPKWDWRWKLGKMTAAIAAGTNATKGKFHGSNVLVKGSGFNDHMTNVAGDFASVTNLTRSCVVFFNNDGSATGQIDVGHQDAKPFDEFGDVRSSVQFGLGHAAGKGSLFLTQPPDCST